MAQLRPKAFQLFFQLINGSCFCRQTGHLLTAITPSLGKFSQPRAYNCRKTDAKKILSTGYDPSRK